jgi:hypothetical protein
MGNRGHMAFQVRQTTAFDGKSRKQLRCCALPLAGTAVVSDGAASPDSQTGGLV